MEQKDAGGYKYYKCRSMLNSFSGGMVYDRSAKYDSSCYTKSILKNPVAKYKVEKADDTSLLDSTTHLDDDVFNDHNEQSNVADNSNDNKIVYLVNAETLSNSECLSSQTENVDPQELIILSLNDFDTYASQDCQEFTKTVEYVKDLNSSLESFCYGANRSLSQEDNSECSYVYYSTPEFINSNDVSSQEQSDSGCQNEGTKPVSVKKRSHKRKQTYIIKDDCFFELPSGDFDKLNAISLDNRSKKKKFASDKENQKTTLLYKHLNSVEPVKMNSILKSIKLIKNKDESICSQRSETFSEECLNFNSCIETDDNLTSRKASVLSNHNCITISSELTDPDYFEYVEPLEKIIESNMDKLVSPTVEVEDPKKMEILERELVHLKSLYAKKLGFKNIFNTSNDSIINEIFFGESLIYKNIKLDLVFVDNAKVISKDNQDINKFFKPVSLLDSINDLKLFGGLTEERHTEKSSDDENCQLVIDESKSLLKTKKNKTRKKSSNLSEVQLDCLKDKSVLDNFSLNCSSKSHLVELKGNGISRECASNIQSEIKDQYSSIKIKIKKVSDEKNQYIIDGFNKQKSSNIKKKTVNKVINPVRYDCSFCLEKFKTKRLLKSHMSNFHKGPYDVECDICHMKFKKSSAYKKHHSWCEKSKEYPCPLCSKVYCYNGSLTKHLKTHEKNYKLKSSFTEDRKM